MALDLGTLQGHVDLDTKLFEKKYDAVLKLIRALAGQSIPDLTVDADIAKAQAALARLGTLTQQLTATPAEIKLDADIAQVQGNISTIEAELAALRSQAPTIQVQADIAQAEAKLQAAQAELRQLQGARATIRVGADTGDVDKAMGDIEDKAAAGGDAAGEAAGGGLAGGIIAALATIPIAGAIVGIGAAIGSALLDGLQNEVRGDEFMALTGLDEATAAKFGRAAADAYANNFGESIEGNMEAARAAIQAGLLDPNATKADAQAVIEQLTGVADMLGEEVPATARAAAQAIKTGIAQDAAGAMDLLVKGTQAGLNASEDLLDTFVEYGTQFRKVGLEGPQALGLMAQAVRAGARDTDLAADAIKEFSIRATDGSEASAEGFKAVGLSAEEMTAKIAAGGPGAAEGLDQVLDGLRAIEDPAARTAAAVALFGTQAEDLGDALYAMDLSTAVDQLGQVEGAAAKALATLGDNTAAKIASAQRNIEVAGDGIKGALAEAFADPLQNLADTVTGNRTLVMETLVSIVNGAMDLGRGFVEGVATATEAIGDFLGGPMVEMLDASANMAMAVDEMLPGDQDAKGFREWADGAIESLKNADDAMADTADTIRTDLIENGIDPAQEKFNTFADPLILDAAVNDSIMATAAAIDGLGASVDGVVPAADAMTGAIDTTTAAGAAMDAQIQTLVGSLGAQLAAAQATGEGQAELSGRVQSVRDSFISQMGALGMTAGAAQALADKYGLIPSNVNTLITADTNQASAAASSFIREYDGRRVRIFFDQVTGTQVNTVPGAMRAMSSGGYTGPGGKYDVAGIVHKGEFVLNQETTSRYWPLINAMHQGTLPGYAGGGLVAGATAPAPMMNTMPAQPAPSRTRNITINNYDVRPRAADIFQALRQDDLLGV